mmetsp:Transcript_10807/g.14124  ORF Transcript_10807/g.14124 Transcript_10807/m.14124 type:complete len:105 (+) Transcript_10807:136-450(+)
MNHFVSSLFIFLLVITLASSQANIRGAQHRKVERVEKVNTKRASITSLATMNRLRDDAYHLAKTEIKLKNAASGRAGQPMNEKELAELQTLAKGKYKKLLGEME